MIGGVALPGSVGAGRRGRAEARETRWRGGRSVGLRRARLRSGLRGEAAGRRARRVSAVLRSVAGLLVRGLLLAVVTAVLPVVLVVLGAGSRRGDHARIQQK